jgi:O-antigen/teichoic acid export membrane protein
MDSRHHFLSRIFKNIGFGTIAILISKLSQLVLFVLIARWLGAEGVGQYTYALSVVLLIGVLSDLGISQYVVSQVAATGQGSDWYLSHTFTLRLGLSLAGLGLVFILGFLLPFSESSRTLLYLLGVGQFLVNVTLGWRWLFQAKQKLQYEALLIFVSGLVYSLGGLALLSWKKQIVWIGVSYFLSGLAFFGVCYWVIRTRFSTGSLKIDLSAWKQILSGAFPMTLTIIFVSIYLNADTILLAHFKGETAAGIYNASNRLTQQLRLIPALVGPAFMPALAQLAAFDPARLLSLLRKGLFYLFTLFLPVAILISFAASDIVHLLYGKRFADSASVLLPQIWSALFMILYAFIFNALMALKKFKTLAFLSGGGALVNLTLNLILIPSFSFQGSAYAIFVSEFVVLTGTILALQRQTDFQLRLFFKRILAPVGAGLVMVTCWLVIPEWNWIVLSIVSFMVYFSVLLLARGIPVEDWQVWKTLLLRKKEPVVGGLG